jgi:hypothetical protein
MEDILTQRFNYATIIPFKNYCKLSEKKSSSNTFNDDLEVIDGEEKWHNLFEKRLKLPIGRSISFTEPFNKKKKTKFFYNNQEVGENLQFNYAYKNHRLHTNCFDTTKDNQIKRHFGNPFSEISISVIERSVRRHDDKITMKVYRHYKRRGVNCIYFKKGFSVDSLTFNTKTGNFTVTHINSSGKSKSKRFRKNCFISLQNFINSHIGVFKINEHFLSKTSRLFKEFNDIFDNNEFSEAMQNALGLDKNINLDPDKFLESFLELFVKTKQIKVPNNYSDLLIKLYPTEKYLKKNDRKLIASILDMCGIKSKVTIKLCHTCGNIDIKFLTKLCSYFGKDFPKYLGSIRPELFSNYNKENYNHIHKNNLNAICQYSINDNEKENLVKVFNDGWVPRMTIDFIEDHFNMINKIKVYDPSCQMRAKNRKEFDEEHIQFTRLITAIRKGWVIEYQFHEKMINEIEAPIKIFKSIEIGGGLKGTDMNDIKTIYPHILKRDEEYQEEGSYMHHCVASYADKDKSIIVSFRTEDKSDRVTCEYDCQSGELIQARHFCNASPPDYIKTAIDKVSPTVKKLARLGLLHSIEKKKVPIKINGIEIQKDDREPRRPNDNNMRGNPFALLLDEPLPF